VLAVQAPTLLRYSWQGKGERTQVTYSITPTPDGSRFTYEHTGFSGVEGLAMSQLDLGPVRRELLDVGLPELLDRLEGAGTASGVTRAIHAQRVPALLA
jgi:hypothetical protein